MNIKRISFLVFILLIIILVLYFVYFNRGHIKLHKSYDLFIKDKEIYADTNMIDPSKEGIKYSLSVWIRPNNLYLNTDWNNNPQLPKTVLNNNGSPDIYWFPETNLLKVQIIYNEMGDFKFYDFDLENFATQKWSNILLTVDNKEVLLYKDGELYKVKKINNPNILNYRTMQIGEKHNNFNGYIGNIDFYNYVLSKKDVKKHYNKNIKKHPKNVKRYQDYLINSINE